MSSANIIQESLMGSSLCDPLVFSQESDCDTEFKVDRRSQSVEKNAENCGTDFPILCTWINCFSFDSWGRRFVFHDSVPYTKSNLVRLTKSIWKYCKIALSQYLHIYFI